MRLLTREALIAAVRKAKADKSVIELGDDVVRTVCEDRVRAAPTDEDKAKVKEHLGDSAAEGRIVPFTISTERRASDGHTIKAAGWALERYRKNPVVLHGHSRWSPRIADSVVEVVDNRLRGIASFFPREMSSLSWELGEIAASRGHAASVGFRILRAVPAPEDVTENIPWALDIEAARLDEWSLVTIGADEDALVEARADGLSTEAIGTALARILDERQLSPALRAEVERLHKLAAPTTTTTSLPPLDLSAIDAGLARQRQLLQG